MVLVSRFIPGSRLPLFLAAGILRAPFARVALALFLAGVVWTPLLVGLSAWTGGAVLAHFRSYERVALPAVLAAFAVVFLFVRIVVPLFTWRGRRLLLSRWRRLTRWEFWPVWLFELPVVLHGLWLGSALSPPDALHRRQPRHPRRRFRRGVEERHPERPRRGRQPGAPVARFVERRPAGRPGGAIAQRAAAIRASGLDFPVVLKPDVGERGRGRHRRALGGGDRGAISRRPRAG